MPIFVWAAIAIAIVLLSFGGSSALFNESTASLINGPTGKIIAGGVAAALIVFSIIRARSSAAGGSGAKESDEEDTKK